MIDVPARVKDALREGCYKKNYKFNVLDENGDVDFYIDNASLVAESVKIDERMCTGSQLKFGLCEGSSLEFQYFNNPNINGRRIQALIEVQYEQADGTLAWYSIPMGYYTVDQCPVQFSTGIRKVTAYNKLRSSYLDAKANALIIEQFSFEQQAYVTDVINALLKDYSIDKTYEKLPVSRDMNAVWSLASDTYVYNNLYGDQGPFGPINVAQGNVITTSTTVYFQDIVSVAQYGYFQDGVTIRINPPEYLDELDSKIVTFYRAELAKIKSSTSATTLWNRIKALRGDPNTYLNEIYDNYFFCISVRYVGGTIEYYGRNVVGSKGSFADLAKLTLRNVMSIGVTIPTGIYTKANLDPTAWAIVFCRGADREYYYSNSSSDYTRVGTYNTPKMPDGSDIPEGNDIFDLIEVYQVTGGETAADYIRISPTTIADVTLRELQSAVYEMNCQYGQLSRTTDIFSGIELNNSALFPADTLYPADNLYPNGNSVQSSPSMYQKLWTDSQGMQSFRKLIITYKAIENNQEVEKILERTINANGTTDYYMSDNWLFKNLVWTAQDVGTYADAMVLKMQNVSWFPFEMWCAGLPYIETGDELEITSPEGTYTSYVLQRQLNGIQNLQDTYIDGELDIF